MQRHDPRNEGIHAWMISGNFIRGKVCRQLVGDLLEIFLFYLLWMRDAALGMSFEWY